MSKPSFRIELIRLEFLKEIGRDLVSHAPAQLMLPRLFSRCFTKQAASAPLKHASIPNTFKIIGRSHILTMAQRDDLEQRKVKLYEAAQMEYNLRDTPKIHETIKGIFKDFPPCMHAYNIVLKTYILLNDTDGIKRIVELVSKSVDLQPNTITYSLLISYYRNLGRMDDALTIFDRMKSTDCRPNASIYTTLIAGFAAQGNFSIAERIYIEGQKNGTAEPDLHMFNAMIACYLAAGKPADAREVAKKMIGLGIEPNHVTYKVFLSELLTNGQIKEARDLYELHLKNSESMKALDYGEVATRFSRAGDTEKGLEIYEHSMRKFGRTSGPAHSYAIDAYSFKKEDEKVEEIRELCLKNRSVFASCCHALLRHYVKRYTQEYKMEYAELVDRIYAASIESGFKISPNMDFKCKEVIAAIKLNSE